MLLVVPIQALLGIGASSHQQPASQQLKINNPQISQHYHTKYKKLCKNHGLFKCSTNLWTQIRPGQSLTHKQKDKYEAIDGLQVQAIQTAEHKCWKLWMGNIEWSPDLATSKANIAMWTALI